MTNFSGISKECRNLKNILSFSLIMHIVYYSMVSTSIVTNCNYKITMTKWLTYTHFCEYFDSTGCLYHIVHHIQLNPLYPNLANTAESLRHGLPNRLRLLCIHHRSNYLQLKLLIKINRLSDSTNVFQNYLYI